MNTESFKNASRILLTLHYIVMRILIRKEADYTKIYVCTVELGNKELFGRPKIVP